MKWGTTRDAIRAWATNAFAPAALLCSWGCQVAPQTPANTRTDAWVQVVTPHFTLSTDQPELQARETARELEEMRAALLTLAWTGARNPPRGRIDVIAFRTPAEFDRYSGMSAQVDGLAKPRSGLPRLLAFGPGPERGVPAVVVHEMVHDLSEWFLPIQPPWLAEGLAVYLEHTKYDRASGRGVMGTASRQHAQYLVDLKTFVSSQKLFDTTHVIDVDVRANGWFYASAWSLVNYLMNAESEGFGAFQTRLAHLVGWRQAWQEAFPGVTPAVLDQRVQGYLAYLGSGGTFTEFNWPVAVPAFEPRLRAMSEAERHGVLAQLEGTEGAKVEAAEALRLDPSELNALWVQFHALPSDASADRRALAQRAVAAHPDQAMAWLLQAKAETGDARSTALQHAQELEPAQPGVLTLLAEDLVRSGHAREALAYTDVALRRSTLSMNLAQLHLQALVANGRCEDASWLESNAEGLFAKDCTVQRDGLKLTCSEDLQKRWPRTLRACRGAVPETEQRAQAE